MIALRVALTGLRSYSARTLLALFGVPIGVAAALLAFAVHNSVLTAQASPVAGLGPNLLVVFPTGPSSSGVQVGFGTNSITNDDFLALDDPGSVPHALGAAPTAGMRVDVSSFGHRWQTDVVGSTAAFPAIRGYDIASGRSLTDADVRASSPVAILGQTVVDNLFGGEDPVGRSVSVNGLPYRVIGVFGIRGSSGSYDQDDIVVLPITTVWAQVLPKDSPRIQQVVMETPDRQSTAVAEVEANELLMARHHITDPAQSNFQVRSEADVLTSLTSVDTTASRVLAIFASLALIAGLVGVLDLMLSVVASRSGEIGIRRASGARRADIRIQFMVEGAMLAGLAGIIGALGGEALVVVTRTLVRNVPPLHLAPTTVLLTVALSICAGAAAGMYAGVTASAPQPAEALRRP